MSVGRRAAIVFAAATVEPSARLRQRLAAFSQPFIVAADQGAATALTFGYQPDVVVGDLDSIDDPTLLEVRTRRVPIEQHPRDKDATDGQLAIQRALTVEPTELVLIGFLGGPRLDQALASVFLLATLAIPTVLLDEHNECRLVRPGVDCVWQTQPGEVVSLLPLAASVEGVHTRGLRWPLHGERLVLGQTRGVSNEPVAGQAGVSIQAGLLLLARHFQADCR